MNINFEDFMIPTIVMISLTVGYLIKSWSLIPNKWIPTITAFTGLTVALWINGWSPSPDVVMQGLVSGLGSCGLYDTYKHFLEGRDSNE